MTTTLPRPRWRLWIESTGAAILASLLVTAPLLLGSHYGVLPDFAGNRWVLAVAGPLVGVIVAEEYLKKRSSDA